MSCAVGLVGMWVYYKCKGQLQGNESRGVVLAINEGLDFSLEVNPSTVFCRPALETDDRTPVLRILIPALNPLCRLRYRMSY